METALIVRLNDKIISLEKEVSVLRKNTKIKDEMIRIIKSCACLLEEELHKVNGEANGEIFKHMFEPGRTGEEIGPCPFTRCRKEVCDGWKEQLPLQANPCSNGSRFGIDGYADCTNGTFKPIPGGTKDDRA